MTPYSYFISTKSAMLPFEDMEKRWNMPLALLAGNGVALRRRLLSMGLHLCLDAEAQVPLMHYLLWSQPEQRMESDAA